MKEETRKMLATASNIYLFDTVKILSEELCHDVTVFPYIGPDFTKLGIPSDGYLNPLLEKSEMIYQIAVELKRRKENDIVVEDELFDENEACREVHEITIKKPEPDENGNIEMV